MANYLKEQKLNMPRRLYAFVLLICITWCPAFINAASAQVPTKTIYFLSGLRDHAPRGGGRHEVAKDMLVLQHCIDSIANVKGVKIITKYLAERTALNIEDFKGVDAIIVEASSVTSQPTMRTHPIFPPLQKDVKGGYDRATLKYLDQIDSLQKAGMGIMMLHWGITAEGNQPATAHYLRWFGEAGHPNYTQNPLGFWSVTPIKASAKHPILRGIKPFVYKDEIFSRLVVNPGDPYRTDLLMGESPETNQSETEFGSPKGVISPRCIASVYEKGKQRGALWGGMDFHSALLNENYLRFVLNEIVWVAGIDVPKGGVKTNAKQLQLAPINTTYENTKIPEGYIAPKLPNTK